MVLRQYLLFLFFIFNITQTLSALAVSEKDKAALQRNSFVPVAKHSNTVSESDAIKRYNLTEKEKQRVAKHRRPHEVWQRDVEDVILNLKRRVETLQQNLINNKKNFVNQMWSAKRVTCNGGNKGVGWANKNWGKWVDYLRLNHYCPAGYVNVLNFHARRGKLYDDRDSDDEYRFGWFIFPDGNIIRIGYECFAHNHKADRTQLFLYPTLECIPNHTDIFKTVPCPDDKKKACDTVMGQTIIGGHIFKYPEAEGALWPPKTGRHTDKFYRYYFDM